MKRSQRGFIMTPYAFGAASVPYTFPSRTVLKRAAQQSISNSTWTQVAWDTKVLDEVNAYSSGNSWSVPSGYTRMRVNAMFNWANNSTGYRYHTLIVVASGNVRLGIHAAGYESNYLMNCGWIPVSSGDSCRFEVNQTSGGALNLSGTGWPVPTQVEIEWA